MTEWKVGKWCSLLPRACLQVGSRWPWFSLPPIVSNWSVSDRSCAMEGTVLGEDVRSENLRKAFLSKFRQVSSLTYEKNKSKTHVKNKTKQNKKTRSLNPLATACLQVYFPLLISQPSHIDNQFHNISCLKIALLSNKAQNTHC